MRAKQASTRAASASPGAIERRPRAGRADRPRRCWEIRRRPPCARRRRRSATGTGCRGCAAARARRGCRRPRAARRLLPAAVPGSTRPPALAPAAAHSSPRPKMAPRCVLTPEVAASMAASASRPMILSRPIPQPRAPASARAWKYGSMAVGAGAERSASISVVAAAVDMADEAGLRPGLQLQQQAMHGARGDGTRHQDMHSAPRIRGGARAQRLVPERRS